MVEQYPVSSMQKTGWTNHSSFLVWSVKGFHLWMLSFGGIQQPFFCVLGHFRHGDKRTTNWVILRKTSKQKKTFSFGHCPNHLTPPFFPKAKMHSIQVESQVNVWKVFEHLRIKLRDAENFQMVSSQTNTDLALSKPDIQSILDSKQ